MFLMIYIFSFHIVTIYRSNWWWSLHSPRWWGKLPLPSSHSKVWQVQRKMVHWKGFNSFPSHVVNKRTGLEDPLLWNMAKKGDISSKEILRIGMFRTPFSCGYYQQHIFCETKIILSSLFLLEAHGLEYLYYRPIIIKYYLMVTHA